jgi:predicted nucleic acid-binding protein
MQIVIDTSIVIEIERENIEVINKIAELKEIYPSPPKISFITYFEFLEGISKRSIKNKERAMQMIDLFEVIQTTKKTAHNLVNLKGKYEFPIPDLIIAAQTIELNGVLVTKDNDFKNINELNKIIISS